MGHHHWRNQQLNPLQQSSFDRPVFNAATNNKKQTVEAIGKYTSTNTTHITTLPKAIGSVGQLTLHETTCKQPLVWKQGRVSNATDAGAMPGEALTGRVAREAFRAKHNFQCQACETWQTCCNLRTGAQESQCHHRRVLTSYIDFARAQICRDTHNSVGNQITTQQTRRLYKLYRATWSGSCCVAVSSDSLLRPD